MLYGKVANVCGKRFNLFYSSGHKSWLINSTFPLSRLLNCKDVYTEASDTLRTKNQRAISVLLTAHAYGSLRHTNKVL